MTTPEKRPKKSLRTLLMIWFLSFSVVPLAFITGYSLEKYEQAIDQELVQRLEGNRREIAVILRDLEEDLMQNVQRHRTDNSLIYYLSKNAISQIREIGGRFLKNNLSANRLLVFNRDGRLIVSLTEEKGGVERNRSHEELGVGLSDEYLSKVENKDHFQVVDVRGGKHLELVAFAKIVTTHGNVVGYLEEKLILDQAFLSNLKSRFTSEVMFLSESGDDVVASDKDLEKYKKGFFANHVVSESDGVIDLNIREVPHGFMVRPMSWGDQKFLVGIGASKRQVKETLENVKQAFYGVVGLVVALLVILSLVISKILLRPLSELVSATQNMNPEEGLPQLPITSGTELGLLTESFNEMSQKVNQAQEELKDKIKELEKANAEIRDTQAKLVHTAKMASLGQLVAGVAHELNNPIGFIYSNMGHLRDYSNKLVNLVKVAEASPDKLAKEKEAAEFDYIIKDMPKLITSCEEGARRTRDIVVGLRNFSRLEEAKIKEIDVHEGLENTLNLLRGELKNRIQVHKEYGDLPAVRCYPSQLNQVFMNILSNGSQAIAESGDIYIKTRRLDEHEIEISIKDTGKGMNASTVDKIFDPFFTTKTLGKGTGLGLSISYGIVQNHGGDIQVKSQPGKGTEFIITLPVKGPQT